MTTYTLYNPNNGTATRGLSLAEAGKLRLQNSESGYSIARGIETGNGGYRHGGVYYDLDFEGDGGGWYFLMCAKYSGARPTFTVIYLLADNRAQAELGIYGQAAIVDRWRDLRDEVMPDADYDAMLAEMKEEEE